MPYPAAIAHYHEADARLRSRSGHQHAAAAAHTALATAEQPRSDTTGRPGTASRPARTTRPQRLTRSGRGGSRPAAGARHLRPRGRGAPAARPSGAPTDRSPTSSTSARRPPASTSATCSASSASPTASKPQPSPNVSGRRAPRADTPARSAAPPRSRRPRSVAELALVPAVRACSARRIDTCCSPASSTQGRRPSAPPPRSDDTDGHARLTGLDGGTHGVLTCRGVAEAVTHLDRFIRTEVGTWVERAGTAVRPAAAGDDAKKPPPKRGLLRSPAEGDLRPGRQRPWPCRRRCPPGRSR